MLRIESMTGLAWLVAWIWLILSIRAHTLTSTSATKVPLTTIATSVFLMKATVSGLRSGWRGGGG